MSSQPTPPTPPHGQPPAPALHALLSGLIDYAGLFPPAKLSMDASVRNYAEYLRSDEAWMLGRFICPVSRLEEFRRSGAHLMPRKRPVVPAAGGGEAEEREAMSEIAPSDAPWSVSAIIDGDLEENLDSIFAFNHEHEKPENGLAVIDAIEMKVAEPSQIDDALESIPEEVFPYFEFPVNTDFRGFVACLAGADAGAKIRTGGVTESAFPSPETVASFLRACAEADVPFKATAGLHHPLRGEHPLTYETDSPRGTMHGFLNVFICAALLHRAMIDEAGAVGILGERSADVFRFRKDSLCWNGVEIDADSIHDTRERFARGYGSCSFREPIDDLRALGMLL